MKIFQVMDDTETVYVTRSESKVMDVWNQLDPANAWVIETELDVFLPMNPSKEKIWESKTLFRKEHGA